MTSRLGSPDSPVVVLGPRGQVGRALLSALGPRGLGLDRAVVNLAQPRTLGDALDRALGARKPAALFIAAAYTAVDAAEADQAAARTINGEAPGRLAEWASRRNIPVVHYSTDYVYPGTNRIAWREAVPTAPVNFYGQTKLAGEKAVAAGCGTHLIFRTSWVYDAQGKNFLNTMLRLGREKETLQVVSDQIGAPTYAPHLAAASLAGLERALNQPLFPAGVFHLCGGGPETSWHGFAEAIFAGAREKGLPLAVRDVVAIPSANYPTPARRPLNSRLSTDKAESVLGVRLPPWRQGLAECLLEVRK